jgi:hypothetical protein
VLLLIGFEIGDCWGGCVDGDVAVAVVVEDGTLIIDGGCTTVDDEFHRMVHDDDIWIFRFSY